MFCAFTHTKNTFITSVFEPSMTFSWRDKFIGLININWHFLIYNMDTLHFKWAEITYPRLIAKQIFFKVYHEEYFCKLNNTLLPQNFIAAVITH